jgi:hypothetical protein
MEHRIMDDQLCRRYFLEPQSTFHRRYVALQAFFVEGRPLAEIAEQYGYKLASLKVMVGQFRAQCSRGRIPPFSSPTAADDRQGDSSAKTGTALTSLQLLISAS